MRHLHLSEALDLHRRLLAQSGGSPGLRDPGALQSALAQPAMTFGGNDLYPSLLDKAAALAYALVQNHPFVDGNKRVAHAAMAVVLRMNGRRIRASVDAQEQLMLDLAAGERDRDALVAWLDAHTERLPPDPSR